MLNINSKILLLTFFIPLTNLNSGLNFKGQSSTLQLSGSANLILSTPLDVPGTIKVLNKTANSLQSTTTNDTLTFSDGVYEDNTGGKLMLTGTIDTSGSDTISLTNGQSLVANKLLESVEVAGTVSIKGQPTFSSAIVLTADSSAVLNLGIENKLSQNVEMNGGTLVLTEDLALQDNVLFSGNGTVNINNKTLSVSSSVSTPWAGNLVFQNANDIWMTGNTNLTGQWTFEGDAETSRINGNGCILDISDGGTIVVGSNHTVYLTDVHLKGLGADGGTVSFTDSDSTLVLSNVTISLDGDYSFSAGEITVQGNNCYLIARNSDTITISTANANITVDGVIFFFDPLGSTPSYPTPIVTSSGGTITLLNDGVIRSNAPDGTFDGNATYSIAAGTGDNQLQNNHTLSSASTITFSNSDVGTSKSITLDGQGQYIQFNYRTGQYMTLAENTIVTMKNVLLKDFDPALINFQGAGATKANLFFGDNCTVEINKDLTLGNDLPGIIATGSNVNIVGNGCTLTFETESSLQAYSTLTMKNMKLVTKHYGAYFSSDDSILRLQDVTLRSENNNNHGLYFMHGNYEIKNTVIFEPESFLPNILNWIISSSGTFKILPGSTLKLNPNIKLRLQASVAFDGGDPEVERRHFKLMDDTSVLQLNSATLDAGPQETTLDYGQIYIDGKTSLIGNFHIGSAVDVEISPAAILDVQDSLTYFESSNP